MLAQDHSGRSVLLQKTQSTRLDEYFWLMYFSQARPPSCEVTPLQYGGGEATRLIVILALWLISRRAGLLGISLGVPASAHG
jgi:hypothetical protein